MVTNTNDFEECYEWIINKHLDYLGPTTPFHINRYYPAHRWHEPPTPMEKLIKIYNYALKQGLEYVYIGNIGDPEYESTKCPRCGRTLIHRKGFRIISNYLEYSSGIYRCRRCNYIIPIHGKLIKA